jgi:hypothetical protein
MLSSNPCAITIGMRTVYAQCPDQDVMRHQFCVHVLCANLQCVKPVGCDCLHWLRRLGTVDYLAPEILECPIKHSPQDNKDNPRIG